MQIIRIYIIPKSGVKIQAKEKRCTANKPCTLGSSGRHCASWRKRRLLAPQCKQWIYL